MTDDTDYEVVLYRKGTAGTITLSKSTANATIGGGVMKRSWQHDENNISKVSLTLDNASVFPTENVLSSSCALWSNGVTGALQMGDYVRYSVYPTSTGLKTLVFYGKITEMRPTADGSLQITALDYLQKFNREYNKTVFANYRDEACLAYTDANGLRTIDGIDATPVVPFVSVGFADTDITKTIGGATGNDMMADGESFAQCFIAAADGLLGINLRTIIPIALTDDSLTVTVQTDNGAGYPSGTVLATYEAPANSNTVETNFQASFVTNGAPTLLTSGMKYWCVVVYHKNSTGTSLGIEYGTPQADAASTSYLDKLSGGSWSVVASYNLHLYIDYANYAEVAPDSYAYDSANARIVVLANIVMVTTVRGAWYGTLKRGKVSYYYGTISHKTLCDALTQLMTVNSNASANQGTTVGLCSTVGKKLIDCLKEIADLWETGGSAWAGYQHAFMHYEQDGAQYIGWGRRLKLTDTSAFTFSHGVDGAVDDEHRIIDYTGLVNQVDVRPAGILVVGGKDANGNPIVASVSDKSLTGSFATQMEDFTNIEKISDQNIVTLADAFNRAYAALDSYQRNAWEGTIRVSGVYPDLFILQADSTFFGSGVIITLNVSPIGISNQKFKVRGVVVHENETEITLSNIWSNIQNRPSKTFLKTDRTEAFLAQVGMEDNIYFQCYLGLTLAPPVYMTLFDTNIVEICARVPATFGWSGYYSGSGLGMGVWHAEFEKGNGTTTDGYPITSIGLYTAATGGSPLAFYSLYATGPPIRNEQFYKWKTQRLIVDFATKA